LVLFDTSLSFGPSYLALNLEPEIRKLSVGEFIMRIQKFVMGVYG
jgi:hypothetical protein